MPCPPSHRVRRKRQCRLPTPIDCRETALPYPYIPEKCYIYNWGERIRTSEWLDQNQLPYHLATPQCLNPNYINIRMR